jgi:diaminopimelate epimerase
MARTLHFLKMSGAGNDFVVIDNREGVVPEPATTFAARVCARQAAIGADGLLLLEKSARKDFRMRYFNTDGSEAEMCGNGGRCIARFATLVGAAGRSMEFENQAGDFRASLADEGRVRLEMTEPHSLRRGVQVGTSRGPLTVDSLNTGVPHILVPWPDISAAPVRELGRELRHHPAFAPKGTNVNFVRPGGPHDIEVRTYERGVEDETLACGTGSVAAAILMALRGEVAPPVRVHVRSGSTLSVHFRLDGEQARAVALEGEAVVLFEGELNLDAFGYPSTSGREPGTRRRE